MIIFGYSALLTLLFLLLSIRTLRLRRRLQIAVGDSGNQEMLRGMRVHANFAEYVPLALILIFFMETSGAPAWLMHLLGSALVIGRLSHAYGVSQVNEKFKFRVIGMSFTLMTMGISALFLLAKSF